MSDVTLYICPNEVMFSPQTDGWQTPEESDDCECTAVQTTDDGRIVLPIIKQTDEICVLNIMQTGADLLQCWIDYNDDTVWDDVVLNWYYYDVLFAFKN